MHDVLCHNVHDMHVHVDVNKESGIVNFSAVFVLSGWNDSQALYPRLGTRLRLFQT